MRLPRDWSLTVFPIIFVALTLTIPAHAGRLHQGFVDRLSQASMTDPVSGIVMLDEQIDFGELEREMEALGLKSRAARHEFVLRTAQELAASSQGELIESLEEMKAEGKIQSYRSFWVTNMIAVNGLPHAFDQLVARADIGTIFENAELNLREAWTADREEPGAGLRDTLPNNLVCANVGPAWDLGFRGQGRLICIFDSGVDGAHESLSGSWRGAEPGVAWWEAWKDPYTASTFPYDSRTHGTHVAGLTVAEKPDGSAIGVAPGAHWIAAAATLQIPFDVQKIIECYEWAVDPDGIPATIDDVPDVINNSWGQGADCDMAFWNAIDLVEAAGIVNTIAVDNGGPAEMSVNSPESRVASGTVNWGVGNVNPHEPDYPISVTSGRGPSPCDSTSIKPEITAPGVSIYSTLPGNQYGTKSGTSMACPHTSGTVAIMRQIDPELTVEEIKLIMMATAVDKGTAGEDNTYGYGILNVGAAIDSVLNRLPRLPPASLSISSVLSDSVSLVWSRPDSIHENNPLEAYRVYRAPIGDPFPVDPIAEFSDTSTVVTFLDAGVPFDSLKYVVTGLYLAAESTTSNQVELLEEVWLGSPQNLALGTIEADTVSIAWERPSLIHPANPLVEYRLYRASIADTFAATPLASIVDASPAIAYVDSGVPYDSLKYVVSAAYSSRESDRSNQVEILEETWQVAPQDLWITSVVADTVSLSWERPAPVHPGNPLDLYRIFRAPLGESLPAEPIAEIVSSLLTPSYVDSGCPFDSLYYVVTAAYADAESGPSNQAELLEGIWTMAPGNLAVSSVVADTVSLAWERPVLVHPDNPLQHYRIFRAPLEGEFPVDPIAEVIDGGETIAYVDSGVPFADWRYAITASYAMVESDTSNHVSVVVDDWMMPPANLTSYVSVDTVFLEWNRPEPIHPQNPLQNYRLFRAPHDEPFPGEPIAEIVDSLGTVAYADSGVSADQYHYAVTALYAAGESEISNEIIAIIYPADPPENLSFTVEADSVFLQWLKPSIIDRENNPLLAYRLYRADLGQPFGDVPIAEIVDTLDVVIAIDSELPYGEYHYAVTAVYETTESDPSNEVELSEEIWTTPPANLAGIVDADTVRLSWDRPGPIHPENPLLIYRIFRAPIEEAFPIDPLIEIADTLGVATFVDSGVPYEGLRYAVSALYQTVESDTSNHAEFELGIWSRPPQQLTATIDADTVRLEWERPAPVHPLNSLLRYRVFRAPLGAQFPGQPIAEIEDGQEIVAYADSGVAFSSIHYMVTALYDSLESDPSNTFELPDSTWASPPVNLQATTHIDSVLLSWERPAPLHPDNELLLYRLYRALDEEPFSGTPLAEITSPLETVAFTDTGLVANTYRYVVSALYASNESGPSNEEVVHVDPLAGIQDLFGQAALDLSVVPNPFNPRTTIRYRCLEGRPILVAVYDVMGRRVRTLAESAAPPAGEHAALWNGTDTDGRRVASGTYFIRLQQGREAVIRRIVLLK